MLPAIAPVLSLSPEWLTASGRPPRNRRRPPGAVHRDRQRLLGDPPLPQVSTRSADGFAGRSPACAQRRAPRTSLRGPRSELGSRTSAGRAELQRRPSWAGDRLRERTGGEIADGWPCVIAAISHPGETVQLREQSPTGADSHHPAAALAVVDRLVDRSQTSAPQRRKHVLPGARRDVQLLNLSEPAVGVDASPSWVRPGRSPCVPSQRR